MNIGIADAWQESQSLWIAARCLDKSSIKTSCRESEVAQPLLFLFAFAFAFFYRHLHFLSRFFLIFILIFHSVFISIFICVCIFVLPAFAFQSAFHVHHATLSVKFPFLPFLWRQNKSRGSRLHYKWRQNQNSLSWVGDDSEEDAQESRSYFLRLYSFVFSPFWSFSKYR